MTGPREQALAAARLVAETTPELLRYACDGPSSHAFAFDIEVMSHLARALATVITLETAHLPALDAQFGPHAALASAMADTARALTALTQATA